MSSSCCHGRADASFFSSLMTTAATKTLLDIEMGIDDNIQIKLPSPNKYLYSMDEARVHQWHKTSRIKSGCTAANK